MFVLYIIFRLKILDQTAGLQNNEDQKKNNALLCNNWFFLYFLGESPENDGLLKVLIVAISGFGG